MNANVGATDRTLRILVGAALMVLAATGKIGVWAMSVSCRC
jgi:hypothetical protein